MSGFDDTEVEETEEAQNFSDGIAEVMGSLNTEDTNDESPEDLQNEDQETVEDGTDGQERLTSQLRPVKRWKMIPLNQRPKLMTRRKTKAHSNFRSLYKKLIQSL